MKSVLRTETTQNTRGKLFQLAINEHMSVLHVCLRKFVQMRVTKTHCGLRKHPPSLQTPSSTATRSEAERRAVCAAPLSAHYTNKRYPGANSRLSCSHRKGFPFPPRWTRRTGGYGRFSARHEPINLPLLNNAKVKLNGNCCCAAARTQRRPAILSPPSPPVIPRPALEDRRAIFFVYRVFAEVKMS